METARGSYSVFSDEQKQILRQYFDQGMTSSGPNMHAVIKQAAIKVNASVDKVKTTDLIEDEEEPTLVKPPLKRATTGYNLFCSEVMTSDECQNLPTKKERLKLAVNKWKALSPDECNIWKEKAKTLTGNDISKLTETQKKHQISKAKKQVASQLSYLEHLGCEASLLLLEPGSQLSFFGTDRGLKFLSQNNKTAFNFMEFFGCNVKDKFAASDVVQLFNQKYCEASGQVSAHLPYLKGDYEVTGLPDGVSFKKPTAYGSNTIQDIMKNADKIKFKMIEPKQLQLATPIVDAGKQATHSRILEKIIDGDKVARVLSGDEHILEQDLEVLNLDLLAMEFHVLISDLNRCFEKDAFLALIANYQSGLSHEGYVLPLYTESEEAFWLFYFPGSSCKIEKLHPEDKIWGYWLDKTSTELEYKLLHDKEACINALNVVTFNGEVGSLRLKHSIPLHNGATIALPLDFKLSN